MYSTIRIIKANYRKVPTFVLALAMLALQKENNAQCDGTPTMTDARDSKVYNIIQIDGSNGPYCSGSSQCWMAENLNHGTRVNGGTAHSNDGTIEKHCVSDLEANCTTYGGLYFWDELMAYGTSVGGNGPGPQGICPAGWHVPTDNEWKCMEMNLGLTQVEADQENAFRGTAQGGDMKTTGVAHWTSPNTGATNTTLFSGLPTGYRNTSGGYSDFPNTGYFYTSTESDPTSGRERRLFHNDARIFRSSAANSVKENSMAVRCVRDNAPIPLPVELLFFDAKWLDGSYETVELTWETASEINNSHFDIERSTDAINFDYLKTVGAATSGLQNNNYTTLDEDPYIEGTSYYRLKQVDNNGDFEYSNIEALNVPEGLQFVNLYPNPVFDQLKVLFTASTDLEVAINIKNNLGQTIRKNKETATSGFNSVTLNVKSLSTGNYILEIITTSGLHKIEKKFIKSDE